ncbi:hypothetical protein BV085_643 [Haemophilus influenzae]|nr:hypothetical protein BV083_645 [Haemophilus influenzae]AVI97478.1 hypothetical protein BV085_643 [Haemophilus influenzae]
MATNIGYLKHFNHKKICTPISWFIYSALRHRLKCGKFF